MEVPAKGGDGRPVFLRDLERNKRGQVAQLVEQRTENPRVGGSIPSLATNRITHFFSGTAIALVVKHLANRGRHPGALLASPRRLWR